MREGCGQVQTWHRMKQLYEVDFFLWTMNNIFFKLIRDIHMVTRG